MHYPRCAVSFVTCEVCGELWTRRTRSGRKARCCPRHTECVRLFNNARQLEFFAAFKAANGVAYTTAKYAEQRAEAKRRAGYTESKRAADARRRARKRGARVETFTNSEIYERDDWRCGICGETVDKTLAYPHPLSASLDHILPLSLGGEHSRANARCSHLTCNVRRGNRAA